LNSNAASAVFPPDARATVAIVVGEHRIARLFRLIMPMTP
jgi:hypothetical protein